MAPIKCSYFMCSNTSDKISMHRFPIKSKVLEQWLENSGNMEIYHLGSDKLWNRFLCLAHFDDKYIIKRPEQYVNYVDLNTSSNTQCPVRSLVNMHNNRVQNRLRRRLKTGAVPRHYKNKITPVELCSVPPKEQTEPMTSADGTLTLSPKSAEYDSDNEIPAVTAFDTDRESSPFMEVLKPKKVYTQIKKIEEPEILVDFETLKRSQRQDPRNSVYHFTTEPMTSADGTLTLLPKSAEYDSDDEIRAMTGFDTGDQDINVDPLDTESQSPVDDPNVLLADVGKTFEPTLVADKPITEVKKPELSLQRICDDGSESDNCNDGSESDDNCNDGSETGDNRNDGSKTEDNCDRARSGLEKKASAPLSIDNKCDAPASVMDDDDDDDLSIIDSYMGDIDPPFLETTISIADLIIPNQYIKRPWRIALPDDVFKIPRCIYLSRELAYKEAFRNKEKAGGSKEKIGVNNISDHLACLEYDPSLSDSHPNRPWRATLPDDNTDYQPTHEIAAQKNGQINIRKQNSDKPRNRNKEYWKSKLSHILHSTQFCGICLCTDASVNSVNDQFDIVVCDNTHTTTLADILHVVFRETEDLLSNSQICDNCTNKLIQSYKFIRQAKETSKLLNLHLNDLYRKSCYIRNNLLGDTNDDQAKASHVVIDLDNGEFSNINSSDYIGNSDIHENRIANSDKIENIDVNDLKDNAEYNDTEVNDNSVRNSSVTEKDDAPLVMIFENNDNSIHKDIDRNKNKDGVVNSPGCLLIHSSRLRVVKNNNSGNKNKTIDNNGKGEDINNTKDSVDKNKSNHKNKKRRDVQETQPVEESKEIYQCKICLLIFYSKITLNKHSAVHFDLRCKICNEVVEDGEIVSHLIEFHKHSSRFCTICNVAFYSVQELQDHQHQWHYSEDRTCLTCLKSCTEDELEQHQCKFGCGSCEEVPCDHHKYLMFYREQVLNGALRPKCLDCEYMNLRISALLLHVNTHHLKIRPFICDVCKEKFYSKFSLNIHFYKCHNHDFKCYQCNSKFNNWDIYRRHISDSHMYRPFQCDECPSSFYNSEGYENHKKSLHGSDKKKLKQFPCDVCKRIFPTNYQKNNHMIRHKIKKMKECDICQKKFARRINLVRHIKLHRSEGKYPCKVCNIEYKTLKEYQEHNPSCFVLCDLCGESMEPGFLRRHLANTHKQKVSDG